MKRVGGVTEQFLSYETFDKAEKMARYGKENKRRDIKSFLKTYNTAELRRKALMKISDAVKDDTFVSSEVRIKYMITGGKQRKICTVPFYPDRILHFATYIMIQERCAKVFTDSVYSYDRGVHELTRNARKIIRRWGDAPLYLAKFDIVKFYDSIDPEIVMQQLRNLIKDKTLLWAIQEMLDSHDRVLIGMLLSTVISTLYLSPIDRFVREELKVKHYYRFADDFILLHTDKKFLVNASWRIRQMLFYTLKLDVRYALVFNIEKRPLDFCGYIHHKTHVLIRKGTKKKFIKNRHNPKSVASYMGMLKWCDSKHLIHKVTNKNNYAKKRGYRAETTSA